MKKTILTLGLITAIGASGFTFIANASDQGENPQLLNTPQICTNYNGTNCGNGQRLGSQVYYSLTEQQQNLLYQGYIELTDEEKELLDNYRETRKRDLTQEQLNEFYVLQDKTHKYMDDKFKAQVEQRREDRAIYREKVANGEIERQNNGNGKGYGNNNGRGNNNNCIITDNTQEQ